MENALTRSDNKVDAVVAANDGVAGGAIQALAEQNLAGKTLVSGQDAELSACQRIAAGTQSMTVYKPIERLAYKAAEVAVKMAQQGAPRRDDPRNRQRQDRRAEHPARRPSPWTRTTSLRPSSPTDTRSSRTSTATSRRTAGRKSPDAAAPPQNLRSFPVPLRVIQKLTPSLHAP